MSGSIEDPMDRIESPPVNIGVLRCTGVENPSSKTASYETDVRCFRFSEQNNHPARLSGIPMKMHLMPFCKSHLTSGTICDVRWLFLRSVFVYLFRMAGQPNTRS